MNNELVSYDERLRTLVVRPRGELTTERVMIVLRTMATHPKMGRRVPSIWDLREASVGAISTASLAPILAFVKENSSWRGRARIGLVTTDPAMYGMMRVYEQLTSDHLECIQCDSMEDAERWLAEERVRGA